jgi:putative oxidoreductase
MERFLGRFAPQLYAILRIVAGLMFFMHGTQKILGWPPSGQGGGGPLPTIALVSGWLELILGALIAVGLLTRIAAFLASGEMAVAYWMVHFPNGFWPIVNQGELPALYCFLFLYIAAAGAGIWSIDAARSRTRAPL